jgi:tetratricopeptide (TPR) repeat protein
MALVVAFGTAPVLAAGGDSAPPAAVECPADQVYDQASKACAPCPDGTVFDADKKACTAKDASLLDDKTLYRVGRDLALAGYYDDALSTLGAIADKHDAMVLTMIGYATRKVGRTEEGIAIYHQALAIDPDNVNTHEYLGEGYLAAGRVDLAELELDTLERLCGTTCDQYRSLQKAIAGEPVWN